MKAWGIQFLVGRSFARIFGRNCLNLGLPIVTCPEAVAAATPGSILRFDLVAGRLQVDETVFEVPPFPPFMRELIAAGGLVESLRRRLDATTPVV